MCRFILCTRTSFEGVLTVTQFRSREKGMLIGASLTSRLRTLGSRHSRYVLQGPTLLSKQVHKPAAQVRTLTIATAKSTTRESSQNSNSGYMGNILDPHPLKAILPALQEVVPSLADHKHKGQAGKIGVIGGCREYTGAPYYAAISALKIGGDLAHVFCTEGAGSVIKSYSPELIVHPVLRESHDANAENLSSQQLIKKVVGDLGQWIARCDCLVIGPGLGRDKLILDTVAEIMEIAREHNTPMVIDGDGLFLVTNRPDLVIGNPLAILTPNVNEYKRLVSKMVDENENVPEDLPGQLQFLAKKMSGVTILQKGKEDLISDGESVMKCDYFGSPRRCGGQGDVLSGSTAVFMSWACKLFENREGKGAPKLVADSICANPAVVAAFAGSIVVRRAAEFAFRQQTRSTLTTDIIEFLGPSMNDFFPIGYYQLVTRNWTP